MAATVSGAKSGTSRPCALPASQMMSHAPPDAVTMPTRRPAGHRL